MKKLLKSNLFFIDLGSVGKVLICSHLIHAVLKATRKLTSHAFVTLSADVMSAFNT